MNTSRARPSRSTSPAARRGRRRSAPKRLSTKAVGIIQQCIEQKIPYYHPVQRCYKLGHTALKGANKWLQAHLYPHYVYPSHVGGGGAGAGLSRGSLVDKQFALWINAGGRTIPPVKHRYVLSLIDAFRVWKWQPSRAQVVVTDGVLGTAVDFEVLGLEGDRPVRFAGELKAGFANYFDKPQGKLKAPLEYLDNSPQVHAMLQLAMGMYLGSSTAGWMDGWVVRVDQTGVHRYRLAEWALPAIRLVVQTFGTKV